MLAYGYLDTRANPSAGIAVAPVEGGAALKRLRHSPLFAWMPDGRAVAYVDEAYRNLWAQPIDGGPPRQLTDFKSDGIWWLAFSRDGQQLALARGNVTSDVVLITDFR